MNLEKRFHELAVKEALGEITPEEELKLERYQALRRLKRLPCEIRAEMETAWHARCLLKELGRVRAKMERESVSLPPEMTKVIHDNFWDLV